MHPSQCFGMPLPRHGATRWEDSTKGAESEEEEEEDIVRMISFGGGRERTLEVYPIRGEHAIVHEEQIHVDLVTGTDTRGDVVMVVSSSGNVMARRRRRHHRERNDRWTLQLMPTPEATGIHLCEMGTHALVTTENAGLFVVELVEGEGLVQRAHFDGAVVDLAVWKDVQSGEILALGRDPVSSQPISMLLTYTHQRTHNKGGRIELDSFLSLATAYPGAFQSTSVRFAADAFIPDSGGTSRGERTWVVTTSARTILVFRLHVGSDESTPTPSAVWKAPGSGAPKTLAIGGSMDTPHIVLPGDNGVLHTFELDGVLGPTWDVGVSMSVFGLHLGSKYITVASERGVDVFDRTRELDLIYQVSSLSLVACGVAISPTGTYVAGGDFCGKICVWSRDADAEHKGAHPVASAQTPSSVRALSWFPSPEVALVFAGNLKGEIYVWDLEWKRPICVFSGGEGGVTTMQWSESGQLVVGTTAGTVTVFDVHLSSLVDHHDGDEDEDEDDNNNNKESVYLTESVHWLAHPPASSNSPASDRFGSLKLFAEVWSIAVSPPGIYPPLIATSSEDQTIRVFDPSDPGGAPLAVLKGHTLAVTGLAWENVGGRALLVSVADDKVVQIFHTQVEQTTQELVVTLLARYTSAVAIPKWHTLTYVVIEPLVERAYVVSQNGFLFYVPLTGVDFPEHDPEVDMLSPPSPALRVHAGSIEGLTYSSCAQVFVTCSSDCSIQEFVPLP